MASKAVAVKRALDELEALGSADKIADFLEDKGIKGWTGNAEKCPVATYLGTKTRAGFVSVSCGRILVIRKNYADDGYAEPMYMLKEDTPHNVSRFVWNFDGGAYPTLERAHH